MADTLPPETETRTVGVVLERRKLNSRWAEYGWRVAQILPGAPASEPWTRLAAGEGWEQFYAGPAELVLFRRETISYKYNLESSQPQVFVVLRQCNDERGIMLHLATVCAGEAHAYAESMQDTVESAAMPEAIEEWVAGYVGQHHVEQKFYKRQRTRVDTESLARKSHLYASDPFRQVPEDE